MLSDSESDSAQNVIQLTINEHFAKAYAARKEGEELSKLKEKYGSDVDLDDLDHEEDSDSDETEDEDAEELTPAVDAAILRTLVKIRRKDPEIYESGKSIFEEEKHRIQDPRIRTTTTKNEKPVTIKQQVLSSIIKSASRSPSPTGPIPTREEEQKRLREATISAFHQAIAEAPAEEEDDDFLKLREKTKDELEQEEGEYQEFLKREVGEDIDGLITVEKNLTVVFDENTEGTSKKSPKKKKGEDREGSAQEFLMNYILNRGWIDRSAKRIPTYKEVIQTNDGPQVETAENNLEDDEEFEEIAETFETSYNFRFEEPNAATIPMHPRNIDSTVRRKDETRKEARERRKQRKEEELKKKREEVKRMKALKMKELRHKLDQIGREGGSGINSGALADFDLDGDWDSEKHDKQMMDLYEDEGDGDIAKPHWDEDIDIDDIIPVEGQKFKKKKKKRQQKDGQDDQGGVNVEDMDADDPNISDEEWDGTEDMRKRKLQEYMDELYKMEFNDMVGNIPTRFSYTPVASQSYNLTSAEILLANDKELNEYMSIKKLVPYRKVRKYDTKRAEKLKILKERLLTRHWDAEGDEQGSVTEKKPKKRKGKKERQRKKSKQEDQGEKNATESEEEQASGPQDKRQRTEH